MKPSITSHDVRLANNNDHQEIFSLVPRIHRCVLKGRIGQYHVYAIHAAVFKTSVSCHTASAEDHFNSDLTIAAAMDYALVAMAHMTVGCAWQRALYACSGRK